MAFLNKTPQPTAIREENIVNLVAETLKICVAEDFVVNFFKNRN